MRHFSRRLGLARDREMCGGIPTLNNFAHFYAECAPPLQISRPLSGNNESRVRSEQGGTYRYAAIVTRSTYRGAKLEILTGGGWRKARARRDYVSDELKKYPPGEMNRGLNARTWPSASRRYRGLFASSRVAPKVTPRQPLPPPAAAGKK